ncbi:MAG: hypothetical protein N2439_12195, partial [Anaerolineae bacterium]|nr:hypothetical protein [Anaerolineae bacterium]
MTAHPAPRRDAPIHVARRLVAVCREAATWQQLAIWIPPLIVLVLVPTPAAWIAAALILGGLFYLRLDLGLRLILVALPFAFVYKRIGADIYSPVEILTVVGFLAWTAQRIGPIVRHPLCRLAAAPRRCFATAWRRLLPLSRNAPLFVECLTSAARRFRQSLHPLDRSVLLFVGVALLSLVVAADKDAARWELRILIIEPVLVYVMLRSRPESVPAYGFADALAAGGLILAVVGLYQYFFTDYVETVQGVRRILSLYDSPNHVSLFLSRVVPISFCLAAFGTTRRRRLYHAAVLAPLLLCLYLTYSRGAWLLGLPAALIFIGAMQGRRGRLLTAGALAAALLALAP